MNAKNQKKYTVKEIDRISNFLDTCDYAERIEEGEIMKDGKLIGGWSVYVKKDRKSNFSRIINENNQRSYFSISYYFYKRQIIKIIVDSKEYYLNDNKPMIIEDVNQVKFIQELVKEGIELYNKKVNY